MSNQSTACANAQTMSTAVRKPGRGFWRTLFDAWVKSHQVRNDPNSHGMY
jgi:hypothetical protein